MRYQLGRQRGWVALGALALGCNGAGSGPGQARSDAGPDAHLFLYDAASDRSYPEASCADTQVDPHNCGTCGHDCLGGACRSGMCVPLASDVLASGRNSPGSIALDAANVYWIDQGNASGTTQVTAQILKCSKTGCGNSPTVLAQGDWRSVTNLVVHGNQVYWGAASGVFACSTDGCNNAPKVLWADSQPPTQIGVDDNGVVYILTGTSILDCPASGCPCSSPGVCSAATALDFHVAFEGGPPPVSAQQPAAFVTDSQLLYAVLASSSVGPSFALVAECALGSCVTTTHLEMPVLQVEAPALMALDPSRIYVVEGFRSGTTVDRPGTNASISAMAKQGATSTTMIVGGMSFPSALVADDTNLYFAEWGDKGNSGGWSSGAGRIARCALTGCNGLATTVQGYVNFPQAIAVDAQSVYWTDFGSSTDQLITHDGQVRVRGK